MYYSLFEQHYDGTWWYHGDTYEERKDAEKELVEGFIYWDDERPKRIFEHRMEFSGETLSTDDFVRFFDICGNYIFSIEKKRKFIMKATKIFNDKNDARAWIKQCKQKIRGCCGGNIAATGHGGEYTAMIFGSFTEAQVHEAFPSTKTIKVREEGV